MKMSDPITSHRGEIGFHQKPSIRLHCMPFEIVIHIVVVLNLFAIADPQSEGVPGCTYPPSPLNVLPSRTRAREVAQSPFIISTRN